MGAINGSVHAIAVRGTTVYAGGTFSQIDGCACFNLGRWDGDAWAPLGSGTNGSVNDIAVDGPHVYVNGGFSLAGGLPAMGMSVWHEQHAQEPPPTITPTPTATATPHLSITPTATAQPSPPAPTQTPMIAAERTIYLPLLLR